MTQRSLDRSCSQPLALGRGRSYRCGDRRRRQAEIDRFSTDSHTMIPALAGFSEHVTGSRIQCCSSVIMRIHSGRIHFAHGCGHRRRSWTANSGVDMVCHYVFCSGHTIPSPGGAERYAGSLVVAVALGVVVASEGARGSTRECYASRSTVVRVCVHAL